MNINISPHISLFNRSIYISYISLFTLVGFVLYTICSVELGYRRTLHFRFIGLTELQFFFVGAVELGAGRWGGGANRAYRQIGSTGAQTLYKPNYRYFSRVSDLANRKKILVLSPK